MRPRKGYLKGQSTIEYLMTYGFAFFVIVLVLALLFGLVLPALKAPESCQFSQPGFSCSQKPHSIFADSGTGEMKVAFQLDNQQGRGIVIDKVVCAGIPPGNIEKDFVLAEGSAPAETQLKSGSAIEIVAPCVDESGAVIASGASTEFQGSIALVYKYENDLANAPSRLAVATLTGAIQQG